MKLYKKKIKYFNVLEYVYVYVSFSFGFAFQVIWFLFT